MDVNNNNNDDLTSDLLRQDLLKALSSIVDNNNSISGNGNSSNATPEICVKFKYNNEKRQFNLKKPLTYSFLINLINTKFDTNLIPYYTITNQNNAPDLICPLESQHDLDYAIKICEQECLTKNAQKCKLNIQLIRKSSQDEHHQQQQQSNGSNNNNNNSSNSNENSFTGGFIKNDANDNPQTIKSKQQPIIKQPSLSSMNKSNFAQFISNKLSKDSNNNNNNDNKIIGANLLTKQEYLTSPTNNNNNNNFINNNGHSQFVDNNFDVHSVANSSEGYFIPDEEDNEYYRETKYSVSDGASGLGSFLSHDELCYFDNDNRKIQDNVTNVFQHRRAMSTFQANNNMINNENDHHQSSNTLPRLSTSRHASILNKFQGNGISISKTSPNSQQSLKNCSKNGSANKILTNGSSSESSSGLGDSPNTPQPPKNWKLGKEIGHGGFGVVSFCSDSDTGRVLAVKHTHLNDSDQNIKKAIRMLQLEIEMLKTLSHDRIVQYYGTTIENNQLYIFVEYMAGGSIKDKLDQYGPLSETVVKKYTKQILEGLAYLHSHNVIHRDVKGSNILCDTNGNIKLCDFGASKFMQEIVTNNFLSKQNDTCIGTCHFMSPEIIKGAKYGRKVDIWSLGCTVVEMFTGKPPWPDLEALQLIYRFYLNESPQYTLPVEVSNKARNFLKSALTMDYEQRPTAEALLDHDFLNC